MTFRNRHWVLFDILLVLLSVVASFALRFDTASAWDYLSRNWLFAALLLLIRVPLFYAFGLYRHQWRYVRISELVIVAEAVLLGSAAVGGAIVFVLTPLGLVSGFPRSIIPLEGILTLLLIGGLRALATRVSLSTHKVILKHQDRATKRVLVFGAGDAGAMIVREMQANPNLALEPVGFLDDDASKRGLYIHDVLVLGDRSALEEIVKEQHIDEVILAIPSAPGRAIRDIIGLCRKIAVPVKTIPGLYEILDGSVRVSAIREVDVEDLLRRKSVKCDFTETGKQLRGARVLVTGAGGSIGSELCSQIAPFEPERLILFELSENNLYQIHRQLTAHFPWLCIVPIIGDVRDKGKINFAFSQQRPELVFHAAAHKHVPLTEFNVDEVVANNVLGTRNLLDGSVSHNVNRFVLISTDKAVNPKSAMGASKRVAEFLVQNAARRHGRAFVAVRFGNVLGSSGSVVPLFKEQIAVGGPVTVTDPDTQRYFMTIPEAVSLVIQAAVMGEGGEVFVLDMGEPVSISSLATDMIRLSGLEPGRDIEIVFTGLRPGEKLREELFTPQELPQRTKHPQILVVQAGYCGGEKLCRDVAELESLIQTHDIAAIKAKLKEIVPEYIPNSTQ